MDASFSSKIDKVALKVLTARSDAKGLAHLAGHLGALAVTAWLVSLAAGGPWLLPAALGHGMVLIFLFAPLHETIHRTAFRTRWLNDTVAWICGAVLVLPPAYFRAFHFAHHRFTQDPARDPELSPPKARSLGGYLTYVSGLPYWRKQLGGLSRHAAGRVEEPFIAASQRAAVIREARALVVLYLGLAVVSLAAQSWAAVLYWALPVILGQPFLRLYLLAEHTGCPEVPDMIRNTRTIRTLWPLRALAWNMPFHIEHHAYPGVPFHALPAAHAHLKAHIPEIAPGYLAVHRQILGGLTGAGARTGQATG